MVSSCKCNHASQDRIHGAGRRVFNVVPGKGNLPDVHRCTVCGTERKAK